MLIPFDLFFSTEQPFATTLNLLILALATVAALRAVVVLAGSVPRERRALERVRAEATTREQVVAATAGTGSLVEQRVADLELLHRNREPVDTAALTGLTTATLRAQLTSAEGIGRSLVVLGLLGTLWGLGSAVTSLAGTLSTTGMNTAALTNAILGTLGGLQTAFSTTLAGLAGALTVGLCVALARQRQAEFLRDLERVMTTRLVPMFNTSDARNLADAARALEQMERRVAEDMLAIIARIGDEGAALRDRLQTDFEQLEAAFERRAQQLIDSTGKALESTLSIIGEREEDEPTLAEYVRTVRLTVEGLERSVQSAGALIPELEARLTGVIDRQRTGLDEVFLRHEGALQPLLEKQSQSTEKLVQVADRSVATSEELGSALNRFATGLDDARVRWAAIDEKVVEIGRSCQEGIENGLRRVVEAVRQDQLQGLEERERIARHLAAFEGELRKHLDHILEDRNRVLRQMTELVDVMREAVGGAVREVGERLGDREHATAREMTLAVETMSRELRGMVASMPRGVNGSSDGLKPRATPWDRMTSVGQVPPESAG